jgi:hypothetical protein
MLSNRLSTVSSGFVAKMYVVNGLQLSEGSMPATKRYQDWHWIQDESDKVKDFQYLDDESW